MPHRNPALLFTPHAAYTVQGTLVRTKHGRIVYARDASKAQVAIKVRLRAGFPLCLILIPVLIPLPFSARRA